MHNLLPLLYAGAENGLPAFMHEEVAHFVHKNATFPLDLELPGRGDGDIGVDVFLTMILPLRQSHIQQVCGETPSHRVDMAGLRMRPREDCYRNR